MPTSDELTELMRAVATQRDRPAFALLFKHFAPRLKTYLVRGGSSQSEAEDFAQEAMVSVWRKAASFDPERAQVSTWIFTIARNLRIDRQRRGAHMQEVADHEVLDAAVDTAAAPDERLAMLRRDSDIQHALAQLTPEQALVVRLSFFDEHPHARIASELQIPLGSVKSRIRLAVTHLRRLLGPLES
jgi:RNA polymerase sigma-70 factor (ECF subfamily)